MQSINDSADVLVSGKTSFKIEVPYKLIETGEKGGKKPLILYMHGFGDNIKSFEKQMKAMTKINAYHLFIQGPYPLYDHSRKQSVSNWGRAWYLYDGNRKQFIKSLEITSEFIQQVVDNLIKFIHVSRMCVIGYSMGGYVAGYFGLTRWKHVNDLIVVGARIKTEIVSKDGWNNLTHLNVLAVHGKNDNKVDYKNQEKEVRLMKKHGISSEFKLIDESHELNKNFIDTIINWLQENNYKTV